MGQFKRISHDAKIMGGKACIVGTRITVGMILLQISEGMAFSELLIEYPQLKESDIKEALRYAAWTVGAKEEVIWPNDCSFLKRKCDDLFFSSLGKFPDEFFESIELARAESVPS